MFLFIHNIVLVYFLLTLISLIYVLLLMAKFIIIIDILIISPYLNSDALVSFFNMNTY